MNEYLRAGGRIVGILALSLGVAFVAAGFALLVEGIPFVIKGGYGRYRYGWRTIEVAVGCGFLAYVCFRYWSRLRKEEREGVQI
jgi:hypothetical protein